MAKSAAYWQKRSIQRLTRAEKNSMSYLRQIHKMYRDSARSVVETVKDMYAGYYRNDATFNLDLLEEIEPKGNISRFMNDMAKAGLTTQLPDNFKGRMTRLKMIEAQLWAESKKAAIKERTISTRSYTDTVTDSYYRTIYDIFKGTGASTAFSTLNSGTLNAILNSRFEGQNYSERIWGNSDKLANSLQDILGRAIATGQSPEKTIREVMERFGVARSNASRLVRTETNYFENRAELESYKELNITKFKFLATLDEKTSDICRSMDSKVFKVKDAMQGENVPPLHPYCRSTIVPVVDGWEPKERFARDPRTGENGNVPLTNYKKWADSTGISGVNEGAKGNRTNVAWRLGEVHMAAMNKLLNSRKNSPETTLFRQFESKLKIADPLYKGKVAHYTQGEGVSLNIAKDSMGSVDSAPYNTTFHELGHNIDYLAGADKTHFSTLYEDGLFYKTLKEEYNGLIEARLAKEGSKSAVYINLSKEIMKIKRADQVYISDIFSGVSGNKVHGRMGHSTSYWTPEKVSAESFTEMFSASIVSKAGAKAIKTYFPKSYRLYRKMLKAMKDGKM